jgi:hypothetical protein
MKFIITTVILLFHLLSFGQTKKKPSVHDLPIPKTLKECFILLDKTLPDDEINLAKTLPEDSIYYNSNFKYGTDFFHAWKLYDGSRLTQYFNKLGLYGSHPIYNTILVSYHRYLNNDSIKLGEQIRKYQAVQNREREEYLAKLEEDSVNGIYIPKDLQDCFAQLDKMLSQKDKTIIKKLENKQETIEFHHSLGMTLRNSWGLWGGSRLQKYFLDKKINHPDDMSALILEYYYEWLNNKNSGWQKWAK